MWLLSAAMRSECGLRLSRGNMEYAGSGTEVRDLVSNLETQENVENKIRETLDDTDSVSFQGAGRD